jgi:chromosome segregation ATPase
VTPEQESNLLSAVQTLQDTVARQGEEIAVLSRENVELRAESHTLRARVDALEAENMTLKHSIGDIFRSQQRQDEQIESLKAEIYTLRGQVGGLGRQIEVKDKQLGTLQRHLEEQARDALEARRLAR